MDLGLRMQYEAIDWGLFLKENIDNDLKRH